MMSWATYLCMLFFTKNGKTAILSEQICENVPYLVIVCGNMFSSHKMFKTNLFHSELLRKESWSIPLLIKLNYSKSQRSASIWLYVTWSATLHINFACCIRLLRWKTRACAHRKLRWETAVMGYIAMEKRLEWSLTDQCYISPFSW